MVDHVIPRQVSEPAFRKLSEETGIPRKKFVSVLADHGNTVSTSGPLALDIAIQEGLVKPGQNLLFLGPAAGISIFTAAVRY